MQAAASAEGRASRFAMGALLFGVAGCVASIQEDRLYAPARPTIDAAPGAVVEHAAPVVDVHATRNGSVLDVSVERTTACRDVDITPRVREVTLRRSFADDAQELNLAFALLFGAGAGVLQYGADQIDCPSGSACWSATITGEYAMFAAAAVPLAFAVYNAFRVRDGRTIETVTPAVENGPWRTCSTEPLPHEPLVVGLGPLELARVTDERGHAAFDLASLPLLPDGTPYGTEVRRAVVHRAGSADVTVDWSAEARPPPAPPPPVP